MRVPGSDPIKNICDIFTISHKQAPYLSNDVYNVDCILFRNRFYDSISEQNDQGNAISCKITVCEAHALSEPKHTVYFKTRYIVYNENKTN